MANNIAHFDIAADDVERARLFYERVFGWRFEPFGPPDFYLIHTGPTADPGIHGSVSKRRVPLARSLQWAYECTISVDDLPQSRRRSPPTAGRSLDEYEIVDGTADPLEDRKATGRPRNALRRSAE
jgi:predicted enzyme related to lactoylglutathione lyase